MKPGARVLALLVFLALLAASGGAEERPVGAVVKESPGGIGEFQVRLDDGHTVRRGDVVVIRRTGEPAPLGEAFVLRLSGNEAVVSLKGVFEPRSGDPVFFGRRPAPVVASPPPKARPAQQAAPDTPSDAGVVQDPSGHFSVRLPSGWFQVKVPGPVTLQGPSGELLFLAAEASDWNGNELDDPEARRRLIERLKAESSDGDFMLSGGTAVNMFGRTGVRMDVVAPSTGDTGYALFLCGRKVMVTIMGVAATAKGVQATEEVLENVRMR